MKRDTFITGPRSKPLRTPVKEAAKFLASICRQFVSDKVTASDVEVAITEWRGALRDAERKGDVP